MMQRDFSDGFTLLAGGFSDAVFDLFNGDIERFVSAPRARRHLFLCLLDLSPAATRSGVVRYGPDAPCDQLLDWVLNKPVSLLKPVLRRLPAVALAVPGQYLKLQTKLSVRQRTGRTLCQFGHLTQPVIDVVLALPDALVEPSVIKVVGDARRAKAVAELYQMALDDGQDALNLGAAIRAATNMASIESVLERAVVADMLPSAPCPDHPAVTPVKSVAELRKLGGRFRNCLRHPLQFQTRGREERSFFLWAGREEAIVAVQQDARGWRLDEVKLHANASPDLTTMAEIVAAFESVGIRDRPDPLDLLLIL